MLHFDPHLQRNNVWKELYDIAETIFEIVYSNYNNITLAYRF